jgi:ribosomal protein S18 acetylase RimI-like enzyme
VIVREFGIKDYEYVIELWRAAGLFLSRSDDREEIQKKLERDADLFIVAEENGRIIGAVMGCYDGRRGWVNHLAVAPDYQGKSLGTLLMKELEKRLKEKGCTKVNLLIEPSNQSVQDFYQKLGYNRDELIFMEKWLL